MLNWLKILLLCLFFSFTQAQTLTIGLILPLSGEDAAQGQAYSRALEAFQLDLAKTKPYLTGALAITVVDSGSSPIHTLELAQQVLAQSVQVLICCTKPEATSEVLPLAQARGLPVISLSQLEESAAWGYSLNLSEEDKIRAVFLAMAERGLSRLAVMAEESRRADLEFILSRLSVPGGVAVIDLTTYPFDAEVLSPEALWVATRQPDAVLLWDELYRTGLAYAGLRARGYEQNVFISPDLFEEAWFSQFSGALSVVAPLQAVDLAPEHPAFEKVVRYRNAYREAQMGAVFSAEGAELYDGLTAISLALEEVMSYGIQDQQALQSALVDSLRQLGEVQGVSGRFSFSQFGNALKADSLVLSRVPIRP
ncbi:MAG: ABC transporter substrate-binding protein [Trueperaceae bacterium]|nr:ABC transporter substrate-binding protein [Trueperaceae bacterium]